MSIAETVGFVVGCDALVVEVILIESVGGQYEEIIVSGIDILYLMVCQIMFPCTNLGV